MVIWVTAEWGGATRYTTSATSLNTPISQDADSAYFGKVENIFNPPHLVNHITQNPQCPVSFAQPSWYNRHYEIR